MTKQQLEQFKGRSIKFSIGGLTFLGAVHYDAWRESFKIIYPIVEDGRARNQDCPLNTALIDRIAFDEEQNLLTMF